MELQMRSELLLVLAPLLLLRCNSGPPDAQSACAAMAHAWCEQLWNLSAQGCADATGIIASYANEQQCENDYISPFGQTCADAPGCQQSGTAYSQSHGGACVSELGNVACALDIALSPAPPDCYIDVLCCSLAGASVGSASECCSGSAHEAPSFSCGPSFNTLPSMICN